MIDGGVDTGGNQGRTLSCFQALSVTWNTDLVDMVL